MNAVLRKMAVWVLIGAIVVIVAQSILGFLAKTFTLLLIVGLIVVVLKLSGGSGGGAGDGA